MPSDELDRLLKKAFDAEKAPDFETTWQRAMAELENRGKRSSLPQRFLIPAMAVGAIAAAVVAGVFSIGRIDGENAPPVANRQTEDASLLLMGLEEPDLPVSPLDALDADWSPQWAQGDEAVKTGEGLGIELTENMIGDGMFESPTDFLLDIEIPQWNGV